MTAPQGLVMVTEHGLRIPLDLKPSKDWCGIRMWEIMIEADLDRIMPEVVAFDGPAFPPDNGIWFPGEHCWNTPDWCRRIMANSGHVFATWQYFPGEQAISASGWAGDDL